MLCGLLGLGVIAVAAPVFAQTAVYDVEIKNRQVQGAPRTIRATQNDTVVLRWRSDEAVRLHLHGYDIEIAVEPSRVAELTIPARATGRFAIEAHGFGEAARATATPAGHTTLLYLEIHPR
ncbi:MAG: hypothetical protein EXQ90_06820 [Rhodospirillales bacterium]|nr:hypothetical protein [Rhodospirillales bacterium]